VRCGFGVALDWQAGRSPEVGVGGRGRHGRGGNERGGIAAALQAEHRPHKTELTHNSVDVHQRAVPRSRIHTSRACLLDVVLSSKWFLFAKKTIYHDYRFYIATLFVCRTHALYRNS